MDGENEEISETLTKLAKTLFPNDLESKIKKLEEFHIEFKNELILRRDQVERLSKDLDSANLEKFQLARSLEKIKATLKQNESTMALLMDKCDSQAEKLKESNEALIGMKLSQDLKSVEVEGLHKFNQEILIEKMALNRQIEELLTKSKCFAKIQSEFDYFKKNLTSTVSKIKSQTEKLEVEHKQLIQMKNRISFEKVSQCAQFYIQENQNLKKKTFKLEEDLAKVQTQYETLENLCQNEKPSVGENIVNKFILNQWKKSFAHFKSQNDSNMQIISKLTEALKVEKSTATKAILKNDELEMKIRKLNENLATVQPSQQPVGVPKEEIIEIE